MAVSSSGTEGHLFGASGRHARVVVMAVTGKEYPVTKEVFSAREPLLDVEHLGAWTPKSYADDDHLPFVIVRATSRSNLASGHDVNQWVREFRPQDFILVGTAGGICRPRDPDHEKWDGPRRGDVVVSEFIHYGDYSKVTARETLPRYLRLEQPSDQLLYQAINLLDDPDSWHPWLGDSWSGEETRPEAREGEILSGEQIQDDPRHATQQYLMKAFDRASAVEMESAGLAQALHRLRSTATYAPGFVSVRGVSDLVWARGRNRQLRASDIEKAFAFDKKRQPDPAENEAADKTEERDDWSPRAAASAAAFALALVQRAVRRVTETTQSHPVVPNFDLGLSDPRPTLKP